MNYVVDASVTVKWFVVEAHRDKARSLLYAHGGNLEAPDLLLIEVANIVWKKVRMGEMKPENAPLIMTKTRDHIAHFHPCDVLLDHALAISLEIDHPIYDCLYLACAEMTGRVLITDDQFLRRKLAGSAYDDRIQMLADAAFPGPTEDFH